MDVAPERLGGHHAIPIIGLSAHAARQDRNRALEAGMDEYLIKPFKIIGGPRMGVVAVAM